MGHRDSSAQLSRDGGIFAVGGGTPADASADTFSSSRIAGQQQVRESARQLHGLELQRPKPVSSGASYVAAQAATHKPSARNMTQVAKSTGRYALLFLIRCYMIFLSPFFGGACKFHPSCSNYAYEAVARHGARRGVVLAVKRLLRCRPFTMGGFDPVPEPEPPPVAYSDVAHDSGEPVQ